MSKIIPINEPVLDGNEKKYLLDCLKRNWISFNGKYTQKFERQFAKFLEVKYALSCSSGTSSIHLALLALGIGEGDEVIIPNFTIIASASTVIQVGAKPVLVDVDEYFCIDPLKIEDKITPKTKAIMVVHMYGNPANMQKIMRIAKKHKLFVIEDACSAHGALFNGKKVGSIGDLGCFSFYSTKIITSGEGGMVVTSNKILAERLIQFRDYGHTKPRFTHKILGYNYRLTDIQASLGLAQLEKIDKKIKKKRKLAENYNMLLEGVKEVVTPKDPSWGESCFWAYTLIIKKSFGRNRDQIISSMKDKGISCERFFVPMSQQPVFRSKKPFYPDIKDSYHRSWDVSASGLILPSGLGLSLSDQKRVVKTLLSLRR